jgi:Tfp pilus assembly protein PilN
MMWIPLGVLMGGVLLAVVIFGFGAYEINWKKNRLRNDVARLQHLSERLATLQGDIARANSRMAAAQSLITSDQG